MAIGDIWYRYVDVAVASFSYDGDLLSTPSSVRIDVQEYVLVRETPKGVWVTPKIGNWISDQEVDHKFIRSNAIKKYAYPTEVEARVGFIARKNAQLRILYAGVKRAQEALLKMQNLSAKKLSME